MSLPPGATLVSGSVPMALPPGATLLSPNQTAPAQHKTAADIIASGGIPNTVAPVPKIAMQTSIAPKLARAATDVLPAIGGTVGSIAASPGVVTTALGGGLGTAGGVEVKQLIDRAVFGDEEPTTTSKSGLKEAGEQAAVATGTGLVLGAAAEGPSWLRQWRASRSAGAIDQAAGDFLKAVPPTKTTPYTPDDLNAARPYLEQEHAVGKGNGATVESVRDAADSGIKNIEDQVHDLIQIIPNEPISTNPISDVKQQLAKNPRGQQFVDAGLKELDGLNLDSPTVSEADDIRRQLNQENKAVLKKNNYDISTARAVDPGFAAREVAAESLRGGIYDQLNAHGVGESGAENNIGVDEMRQQEGSLIKIRNAAQNQILNGDKVVRGTSGAGTARTVASNVVNRFLPGAVKAVIPGANMIAPEDLTRDALLERSFNVNAANPPQSPQVNLRLPPNAQLPAGQSNLSLPPTAQPGQGSLFGVTGTAPLPLEWPKAKVMGLDLKMEEWTDILNNPLATQSEKALARQKLKFLPSAQVSKSSSGEPFILGEQK